MSLILLTHINNKIYLNGVYLLNNDIILTKETKKKKYYYFLGIKNKLKYICQKIILQIFIMK